MRASSVRVNNSAKHRKMLEVLEQFRILFKSVRRHYGEVQRRAGIGGAQVWALSHIASHPGIKPGELARALAIHVSTASNLVRELEKLKLATRRRLKQDQRVVELCVTSRDCRFWRTPRPLIRAPAGSLGFAFGQSGNSMPPTGKTSHFNEGDGHYGTSDTTFENVVIPALVSDLEPFPLTN
jgi:DNA-binding MarR family transcriptional regulator